MRNYSMEGVSLVKVEFNVVGFGRGGGVWLSLVNIFG